MINRKLQLTPLSPYTFCCTYARWSPVLTS